ncbi:MAG: phosphodiester glycosidase family protein [Planctomycetota bacterium]
MPLPRRFLPALATFLGCVPAATAVAQRAPDDELRARIAEPAAWQRVEVGQGIHLLTRQFPALFSGPQSVTALTVQWRHAARFDVVAPGTLTRTSTMAGAAGALAAINGGFYDTKNGDPLGLLRLDGALRSPAREGQASIGFDAQGWPRLADRPAGDWPEVQEARGAGPRLLRDGAVVDHGERQRGIRHPRTAFGVRADGSLLLLTVDGRTEQSAGVSFEELATLLAALGCRDAINLDGGGSSTLFVAGRGVCNQPCDNRRFDHDGERAVADALLLFAPAVVVVDEARLALDGEGAGWVRHEVAAAHDGGYVEHAADPALRVRCGADVPFAGRYRVFAWSPDVRAGSWTFAAELGGAAPVERPSRPRAWVVLGEVDAAPTAVGGHRVELVLRCADGQPLRIDALRFVQR